MYIAIAVILFVLLIIVHEYGHFITAKRNGVEVEEFGIGFPPRVFGKKGKDGVLYSFNLLPLGGFVKLKGEANEDKRKGSFGAATLWVKMKVLFAGVVMNLLTTFVIFLVLALIKMPVLIPGQFTIGADERSVSQQVFVAVADDSPAARAGLETGDIVLQIQGQNIATPEGLTEATDEFAGQEVEILYKRDGEVDSTSATLNPFGSPNGELGVAPAPLETKRYTWSAPIVAIGVTLQIFVLTIVGLGGMLINLFSGNVSQAAEGVTGPIGIFVILGQISSLGLENVLAFMGAISVSLAVLNALPLPALDGGRAAVIALFRYIKKPLTERIESAIHGIGFALLIGLIILISYVDVNRFF